MFDKLEAEDIDDLDDSWYICWLILSTYYRYISIGVYVAQ